jgi:DNA-binding CsgD family transcriptional regulator
MLRILLFTLFLCFGNYIWGQSPYVPGTPITKNFTEIEVNNSLIIYDITQSKNGIMYYATPDGLLEFDGVRWKNYSHNLESDLRAILYKDDKHIYSSGHGGFGYWSTNSIGELDYTSLFFKQPEKQAPLLPIFSKIKEFNGKIFFQSFQQIHVYDPKTNKIDIINAKKGFNFLFSSKNRIFIQETELGLFELIGKEFVLVEGTDKKQFNFLNVFVKNNDELLIVTKNNGFWSLKDNLLSKKEWKINAILEKHLANDVTEFKNNQFVIGTLRKGVYLISSKGDVLMHQEKSNGLVDNTITKVFTDSNNNVWLGMENGVSYIQMSSKTNYLFDYEGEFGTVYTSHINDSLLYFGTNQGLFVKNIRLPNSKIRLINKGIGQIWEIEKIDNQILIGSHEGVFVLENKKLRLIKKEGGAWVFKKHPKLADILYVGFYSGIAVFKRVNGNWVFEKKWQNYGESSRFIEFDKYGELWVAHPSKGYYRLSLSDDGVELKEYEFYGVNTPFVAKFAYICKIDEDLVFYNPKGFFNYDPIDNSFISQKYTLELFKNIKGLNSIVQNENIFWYSTPEYVGYIKRYKNHFNNVHNPFSSLRNKHLNDFNKFEKINDSIYAIGIKNGVVFHTINQLDLDSKKEIPTIRSIQFISKTDTITSPIDQKELLNVPNDNNFLKVNIALPKSPLANSYKIQYKLNGLHNDWSTWDYISELSFPGLSPGDYKLELRSGDENETFSDTISRAFYIKSPWYLTKIAFGFYILLLFFINKFYRAYFKKKSQKQIDDLKLAEKNKRKHQEEKFRLDKLETEREVLILREENLNLEIKKKNSALASSTLNNIKKNELLTDLIKDIKNIDSELVNSSLHHPIKKVIKKIKSHLIDKEDWLTFQLHFSNSHSQFFKNLREKHPSLSSNEIKLCAYLKLNLSSKEIASLMNVAITSVEQSRYRLRKKINLDKDTNLVNYIQQI